jgi:hypothetical protein
MFIVISLCQRNPNVPCRRHWGKGKPNPGNKDVPIFQTVVPGNQHKLGGSDPIINNIV